MIEKQTCPSRMSQIGPWEYKEHLDSWENDRWHTSLERAWEKFWHDGPGWRILDWWTVHIRKSFAHPYRGGTNWRWHWTPRTCSFCGGIHPEDAIKLVREGWEIEATSKSYKRYLNPPGYRESHQQFLIELRHARETFSQVPEKTLQWSPTPPVKLYVEHLSESQIDEFNALLKAKSQRP